MKAAARAALGPGRPISLWRDGADRPHRPRLERDVAVDVAVVGAGILGLSTAFELQRRGLRVAVIEGRRLGDGVTGNTTAKLSSLHGLHYASLASRRGAEAARVYAEANEWGIDRVGRIASELEIDCDLREAANFTYTEDPDRLTDLRSEVEAARAAGLETFLTTELELPFAVAGAIRLDGQAEFQPLRYLLGLASALDAEAPTVFERTRAIGVDRGGIPTEGGPTVSAERIVLATQIPYADRGLYFARTHVQRSYAVSVRVGEDPPTGMYLQAESPGISIRTARWGGERLLIVGGQSHELGHGDPVARFDALERYARERFDVVGFEHRWSAHDFMSEDGLPYVGRLWPPSDAVLTATGMSKWGLAMSVAAARVLADEILGDDNEWASTFDPRRIPPLRSAPTMLKHNADSGLRLFTDRLRRGGRAADLRPGEGRVIGDGLGQVAVHRDDAGRLHAVAARCTHLGCIVGFNAAERTWDCPCHGSRFGIDGEVISGPATRALEGRESPDDGEEA